MFCGNPFRRADVGLIGHHIVQVHVATCHHGHLAAGALPDDDLAHAVAATQGQGLVHDGLEGQGLAAAQLFISRDHNHGAGVFHAVPQALCRETAKHHRVRCTDARTGLHGHHAFHRHRQIQHDAVTLLDTLGLQRIGQFRDARQQILVGHMGDLAVVGLEDDGGLVTQARLDVAVQAVVGGVEFAVLEPLEERGVRFVQRLGERLVPGQELLGQSGPVTLVVVLRLGAQLVIGRSAANVGSTGEGLGNGILLALIGGLSWASHVY